MPPVQTERAFQIQSDCQTLRVAEQGRKSRERRTDVKPASLLVISLFVGSIPAVAVLCDFKMVRIRSKADTGILGILFFLDRYFQVSH